MEIEVKHWAFFDYLLKQRSAVIFNRGAWVLAIIVSQEYALSIKDPNCFYPSPHMWCLGKRTEELVYNIERKSFLTARSNTKIRGLENAQWEISPYTFLVEHAHNTQYKATLCIQSMETLLGNRDFL